MPHPPPERRKIFPLLHRSSLFTRTSAAPPCAPQYTGNVFPRLIGEPPPTKTFLPTLRITWSFCLQSFFPPDAGSRDRNRHAPSPCPVSGNGKNFCLPRHGAPRPSLPGKGARRQHSAARPKVSGKPRFSAKRQAVWFETQSVSNCKCSKTPVRSAGKYVPPAASGSERRDKAGGALAEGQFLPRQIKRSPVQRRTRQAGSFFCSVYGGGLAIYGKNGPPALPVGGRQEEAISTSLPSVRGGCLTRTRDHMACAATCPPAPSSPPSSP